MNRTIAKQKSHAFGKDVYLMGVDSDGVYYWLESPTWDCSWYWGFGYIETYTRNKNPSKSRDIQSHSHVDSMFPNCNLYDSKVFELTTYNEKETWKLYELFKQFYLLRDMADFCHKETPGCHITTSPVNHGDMKELNMKINNTMIPKITQAIMDILTPTSEVTE